MDTSKQYMKMANTPEIQEHEKEDHDWYACSECGDIANEDDCYFWTSCGHTSPFVWLPRQDQLQDILSPDGKHVPLINAFHRWLNEDGKDWTQYFNDGFQNVTSCPFASMEQLWLAFCMAEKYKKYWDGENWIKGE